MPTYQVAANADDCVADDLSYFSYTSTSEVAGTFNGMAWFGCAARFLNIPIPAIAKITLAKLILTSDTNNSDEVVNLRIRAELNVIPAAFSNYANFAARTWTTHRVNWDAIPAWTIDKCDDQTTSPDLSPCISEVILLPNWASGHNIVILWDDFEKRSTQTGNCRRSCYAYDSSHAKASQILINWTIPSKRGWMSK
jgi:hypothetical protein